MKAITLTQPWATLMAAGEKYIETRSWSPSSLHMGQRVAIHAGKGLATMTPTEFAGVCASEPFRSALVRAYHRGLIVPSHGEGLYPGDLPRGVVVAVAEYYTCYPTDTELCQRALARSETHGAPHEQTFGNYAPRRWAWVFVNIRPLCGVIPAQGKQGLWDWEAPKNIDEWLCPPVDHTDVPPVVALANAARKGTHQRMEG